MGNEITGTLVTFDLNSARASVSLSRSRRTRQMGARSRSVPTLATQHSRQQHRARDVDVDGVDRNKQDSDGADGTTPLRDALCLAVDTRGGSEWLLERGK